MTFDEFKAIRDANPMPAQLDFEEWMAKMWQVAETNGLLRAKAIVQGAGLDRSSEAVLLREIQAAIDARKE